jgi:hypothetical protein
MSPPPTRVFRFLFRNRSVCFGSFDWLDADPKQPKQTEQIIFGFAKQTENQPKQIEFRFEQKVLFVCCVDTLTVMISFKGIFSRGFADLFLFH